MAPVSGTDMHPVYAWAVQAQLEPVHVDCATTVMLKILDGKCKMRQEEKRVMEILYDAVKHRPGFRLGEDIHGLIADARAELTSEMVLAVYEQRLYAETMIGRPTMKAFKAMLRGVGIIGSRG